MESNNQPPFHETSFQSDISEADPTSPPSFKNERQRTIEDIRKKFKVQGLGSFKALRPQNLNNDPNNEKDKTSQVLMKKNQKFQDLYVILDIIGQGSFSVVKTVQKNGSDQIYVAKIVRTRDQEHLDTLRNEYRILSKLEHKNIVKAEDFLVDNDTGNAQIILEYCQGKTLQDLLEEKIRIDESTMRHIVEQLISAIDYLHDKGVCHRDISPLNIIINEKNEVKLIDFSVARIFRKELWSPLIMTSSIRKRSSPLLPSYPGMMLTDAGTPAFKAPEVITGIPYNESVDMWSIGVVTFYGLAGYKPFYSKRLDTLYKKISSAKCKWDPVIWKDISYEATLFVSSCLIKFPFLRSRTKEALHHPWIKGVKLNNPKHHLKAPKRSSSTNVEHLEKIEERNGSPKPRHSLYTNIDVDL